MSYPAYDSKCGTMTPVHEVNLFPVVCIITEGFYELVTNAVEVRYKVLERPEQKTKNKKKQKRNFKFGVLQIKVMPF